MGVAPADPNNRRNVRRLHDYNHNKSVGRGESATAGAEDGLDEVGVPGTLAGGEIPNVFEGSERSPHPIGDVQFQHNPRIRDYKTGVRERRV